MTRPSIYRQAARLLHARSRYARETARPTIASTPSPNAGPSRCQLSSAASAALGSSNDPFSTVNADEISHFTRLSSEWWSPTGEFALLHRMNPARVEYIRQKLMYADEPEWTFSSRHQSSASAAAGAGTGKWLAGKAVLDVGCGGGLLAESLARLGGDVLAIDAGQENINIATIHAQGDPFLPLAHPSGSQGGSGRSQKAGGGRLEYRCVPAERLREEGKQYDLVTSMEVVEHVDEPGEFLKCLGDMVKPGGHLILSTISRTPLSQLLTLTLAEDVLRLVTPGTHTYSKFIKPEELRRFVHDEMGGYHVWEKNQDGSDVRRGEVGETRGIVYNPLKGGWDLWAGAEGSWGKEAGELCNYMFYARKRLDAA